MVYLVIIKNGKGDEGRPEQQSEERKEDEYRKERKDEEEEENNAGALHQRTRTTLRIRTGGKQSVTLTNNASALHQ